MKIVGIMGSPRKGGNTEILLDLALKEAQKLGADVSKVSLQEKKISPCLGCLKCTETGKCAIKDDMQEIHQEMREAEGILWATPVYFWSMSGQTKIAMDRTFALMYPKLQLANKVGGLILVAGSRGCVNTANIFHMYFNYNHMFCTEFSWGYARDKGAIERDKIALKGARGTARQMVAFIRSHPKYPEEFDVSLTRFIREKDF